MILSNPFIVDPRVYKEAKTLVDAGHEVTVIVWDRHEEYRPEDIVDGIRIIRIHNEGIMKILPNDLLRNPLWWRKAYKKGLELYKTGEFRFDVVHCHDLDTLQAGVWLKKKLEIKLIYDAHEIFGYMIARNMPKIVVKAAFWMEKRLVKRVDYVITVDDGYASFLKNITKKPITIVRNCKELLGNYVPPSRKIFTLVYIGTLSTSRFFPQLVHVVGKIKDVNLIIAGKKEALYGEIEALAKKYSNIEFLGTIPTQKVISLTLEGHVIVCMFDPNDMLNKIGSPNKLFEAMVCGRPIIVTKGTHAGKIVEEENCGLAIEYNEDAFMEAVIKLKENQRIYKELGKNALRAAMEKYNWGKEKKKLLEIYKSVLKK